MPLSIILVPLSTLLKLVQTTGIVDSAMDNGWLGSRVVSVLDSGAEGPGSNRSRYAVR